MHDDVLVRRYDTLESADHAVIEDGVEVRPIRVTVNPLYDVLGTGDFDGDGADEILIQALLSWVSNGMPGSTRSRTCQTLRWNRSVPSRKHR